MKREARATFYVLEGQCAGPAVCPLSRVQAGATVCIKHLSTTPEVTDRLRELGFCEEQKIKLVACESSYICQVCNARLGISKKLAESILVEPVPASDPAGRDNPVGQASCLSPIPAGQPIEGGAMAGQAGYQKGSQSATHGDRQDACPTGFRPS